MTACWVLICLLLATSRSEATEPKRGVVVLSVPRNSASEAAGIKPGDVLETWRRGHDHGKLASLFDVIDMEVEQCARGPVVVTGSHGRRRKRWLIQADSRFLGARPALSSKLLKTYEDAQALRKA